MRITVTCPCGCGNTFEVDVPRPTRRISEEERQRRSEWMKETRKLSKHPGKTFGAKDVRVRKVRSDKGVPRGTKSFMKDFDSVTHGKPEAGEDGVKALTRKFIEDVRNGATDTKACPLAQENGGPCDGIHTDAEGNIRQCINMQECYFMTLKYLHPMKREANNEAEAGTDKAP